MTNDLEMNRDPNLNGDLGFGLQKVPLLNQCTKMQSLSEDRISQLPNEILSSILSLLTLKEAGRTSILSKRWKNVWTCVLELDFNSVTTLCEATTNQEYMSSLIRERVKFVNWVNKVLESNQTLDLKKFRIYMDLDNSFSAHINNWLQYAFDRRVQRLEVNLTYHGPIVFPCFGYYVFPSTFDVHRSSNSLKILILKSVSVSGEILESLLHNCQVLETLAVYSSTKLITLEICGPSLALRHLEICLCPLKTLIVCDAHNLISLKIGAPGALVLKNVPRLIHIHLTSIKYIVKDVVHKLSCAFSNVEILSLCLDAKKGREYAGNLPHLSALKKLFVQLCLKEEGGMLGLTSFFLASPNLEKVAIELRYPFKKHMCSSIKLEDMVNCCVPCLRVVKISGYRGLVFELELLKCLLRNAISLEKIIVDPYHRYMETDGEPWFNDLEMRRLQSEITNDSRWCAKQQLLGTMPSHITLQIL